MWHLSDAWARRDEPNVRLVHYDDLCADLDGEMRALATWLGLEVPEAAWPELVRAATFEQMRARADSIAPSGGVLKSNAAFFRRGSSGHTGNCSLSSRSITITARWRSLPRRTR